jgi:hypothetical protein
MALIHVVLLLALAVAVLVVLVFHALTQVVVAAVGALVRAPSYGVQVVRSRVRRGYLGLTRPAVRHARPAGAVR